MRALMLAMLLLSPPLAMAETPSVQTRIVSEKDQVDDDGYVVRLSMPTEDDLTAWRQAGIRVSLGYAYSMLAGRAPVPGDLANQTFLLRAGARIDRSWSVAVEFSYAFASMNGATPMTGLRYAATLQALHHPTERLALGLGTGIGGMMIAPSGRRPATPITGAVADVTLPASASLGSCDGKGWVGVARAEYQWAAGSLFATGPFASFDAQYTGCGQQLGRVDKETGVTIAATQWWLMKGASIGWWASWR